MRLEDALLFLVYHADQLAGSDISSLCRDAIGVGADVVSVRFRDGKADTSVLQSVAEVCAKEDALFLVQDDPLLAQELGADGVHLGSATGSIGEARAIAGMQSIVGFTTNSVEEAILAAEVGADYIVHNEGKMCPAAFEQLRGSGLTNLFAGGLNSIEEAGEVVGSGVFRVCVEINNEESASVEAIAAYSRLFGRVV